MGDYSEESIRQYWGPRGLFSVVHVIQSPL